MDLSDNIQLECRICSSPRTIFIQLEGWKAQMFREFVGLELTIKGGDSGICQECFIKLEISYNFQAKGRRAVERENSTIQRTVADTRQKTNEPAQVSDEIERETETTAGDSYSTSTSDQSDDESFACESSLKKFSTKHRLKLHQMQRQHGTYSETPEEIFDCLKCDKAFSSLNYLKMHQRKFHKENEGTDEVRDKKRVSLGQHSELHEKVESSICKKVIEKRFETAHSRSHSALWRDRRRGGPARFECDICGKGFAMKSNLSYHMRCHSKEGNFRCNKFGFGCKSKHELLKHSRSTKTYKSKCISCEVKFSCKPLLDRHRGEFHGNDGNMFKCSQCSYQTKRKDNLMKHKRIHDKPLTCESCQKKFAEKKSLKYHQMHHRHGTYAAAPEETFDCDKCDKSFSCRQYLNVHQRAIHDEKIAKCEVCGKICKNRHSLFNHSRTHNKVECSICHKMIAKHALAAHLCSHPLQTLIQK